MFCHTQELCVLIVLFCFATQLVCVILLRPIDFETQAWLTLSLEEGKGSDEDGFWNLAVLLTDFTPLLSG